MIIIVIIIIIIIIIINIIIMNKYPEGLFNCLVVKIKKMIKTSWVLTYVEVIHTSFLRDISQ